MQLQPDFLLASRRRRSGSALLIILGCVALLTILVTAFLLSARTEFTTSNFYAKGVNTKLLSENVIASSAPTLFLHRSGSGARRGSFQYFRANCLAISA